MTVIRVTSIRHKNVKRKIDDLEKFLNNPLTNETYKRTIDNLKDKWAIESSKAFYVRRKAGFRCDGILAKSLAVVIRNKNNIIIYVEPIVRFSKNTNSSGGPVRNLTTILFRGSKRGHKAWFPRWDARMNTGIHPGTSALTMGNLWKRFKNIARENIREALNRGLQKELNK